MPPLTFCTPSPIRRSSFSSACRSPLKCSYRNHPFTSASTSVKPNPHTRLTTKCVQEATRPAVTLTNNSTYHVRKWNFRGFTLEYALSGVSPDTENSPNLILVHGFGANCRHWRRNLAPLASNNFRVFAPDLIGFGMGDKPLPGDNDAQGNAVEYTFDYWTEQLHTFITQVVQPKAPVFLVANSIGAMVTMQLSAQHPSICAANVFISPSLRQLNVRKRSWLQDISAPLLMQLLAYRPLGAFFLKSVARPKQLSSVLMEAYEVFEAIDNQLIDIIAKPAGTAGALDVFLAFISYDEGPIPEDFLPVLSQPSMVIWGAQDRFEPYELGQALRHYSTVQQFIGMEGVGHCAHDEKPEEVNKLIADFVQTQLEKADIR